MFVPQSSELRTKTPIIPAQTCVLRRPMTTRLMLYLPSAIFISKFWSLRPVSPRHLTLDTRHSLPVHPVRRAIIDAETNSIKLLVADLDRHTVIPVSEQSKQTRLGSGFYDSHRLQPAAIKATVQAVATFAQIARDLKAS